MNNGVLRVRFQCGGRSWLAALRSDESGQRVDLWKGVEWCGQWRWLAGGFGERLQRGQHSRLVTKEVLGAAASQLRKAP